MKIHRVKSASLAALALTGLSLTAQALADPAPTDGASATAWYGSLGASQTRIDGARLGSVDARIGAQITPHLAVEVELNDGLSSDHAPKLGPDARERLNYAAAAYGVGSMPVSSSVNLFARVGVGENRFSRTVAGLEVKPDLVSLNYGVGAVYKVTPALDVRADYTRKSYDHRGGDADNWGLSLAHHF
jgi:hypothetical protein